MEIADIVEKLNLIPHPEGGFFRETIRSSKEVDASLIDSSYKGKRSVHTCIYYLITPDSYSSLHKVNSDEVFHFYSGSPCEMLQLHPDGMGEKITLGNNLIKGEKPQVLVPKNTWQGTRLIEGGKYALLGATVSPGFDFKDFTMEGKEKLRTIYPSFEKEILALL